MKKVSILIIGILSANVFALDINSAVRRGLESNHELKQSELSKKISQTYLNKANSAYRPTLDATYYVSSSDQDSPKNSLNPSYASITLGYNLFNGFKDKYAIEGAKENFKSADLQKEALRADIKLQIQLTYIDFLEKRKTLSTKEEAVILVRKSLKDTQAYFDQGLVAKNSLLETKVSLSKARQDLIIASSELVIARDTLNRLLGGILGSEEGIQEINFEIKDVDNLDLLVQKGLKNRSEIKSFKADIKEADFSYNSSKSTLYPKLDLALSHSEYGEDGKINGRDTLYDSETIGSLKLSYNLYSGGLNEANRAQFMYQAQIAQEKLKTLELDTVLQIKKAKESYKLALENSKVAADTQEFATENFSIMEKRYKAQLEKTTDFLNARLALSEAKIEYSKSLYYIYTQYVTLLRVIEENN